MNRRRWWVEAATALLATVGAVLTFLMPDWIEMAFGIDPDAGKGWLELAIEALLVAVALLAAARARVDWHAFRAARELRQL